MSGKSSLFKFLASFSLLNIALAVPAWDGINGRSAIGSLVLGSSYIEALGPSASDYGTRHLTVQTPGQIGNLTVVPNARAPSLFYINQNHLWQYVNETAIFPVNVVNVTCTTDFPLQLVLGKKPTNNLTGSWRWRGTMLYYDQGSKGNSGLFYDCMTENGSSGVFMFLQPSATPTGCELLTLHSFSRDVNSRH